MVKLYTGIWQQMTQWLTNPCQLCLRQQNQLICQACWQQLPWLDHGCSRCDLPLPASAPANSLCVECINDPPPWKRAVSALQYQPPVATLIHQLKNHRRFNHARQLGSMLAHAIPLKVGQNDLPELLLPVPLHWSRKLRRGFNQSAEITHSLSQQLKIPADYHTLKRRLATQSQQQLSASKRSKNLKKAFSLQRPIKVRHIALIDDVMTTGATARSLASLLLKHQPELVIDIWTVARTPKPD